MARRSLHVIYRAASALASAALRAAVPFGGEDLRERLVLGLRPAASAPIWIHAASVGELNSARPIIQALAARGPVLLTTNTVTGRAVAQGWGLPARLAPLDATGPLGRFLSAVRPVLAVTVENEVWPNRSAALAMRGIPQAVIGARMSARSARRWQRLRGLIAPALGRIDLLSAQDAATEARLLRLGLPHHALAPRAQLKLLAPAAIQPDPALRWPGCWLAASTHEGEEARILHAHRVLTAARPGLRLILAPRHPRRADEVAAMVIAHGLTLRRLGGAALADLSGGPAQVLLVDRLGTMDAAYAAAPVCLTGGSLVARGGHTPWEPAAWECAILHGPHTQNFAEDYAALHAAGGAMQIGTDLTAAVAPLLDDAGRAHAAGAAARATLDALAPDPAPLVAALLALAGR